MWRFALWLVVLAVIACGSSDGLTDDERKEQVIETAGGACSNQRLRDASG